VAVPSISAAPVSWKDRYFRRLWGVQRRRLGLRVPKPPTKNSSHQDRRISVAYIKMEGKFTLLYLFDLSGGGHPLRISSFISQLSILNLRLLSCLFTALYSPKIFAQTSFLCSVTTLDSAQRFLPQIEIKRQCWNTHRTLLIHLLSCS